MNAKAGCAGSVLDLLHEQGFNHQVETRTGILEEECSQMMKTFFKELREMKKQKLEEGKTS
ncbi:tRNA-specific adenosine deaminase [compost metagenome]